MKPYDGWSEHNKALKNPEYQMEGMLDCLREEMMMNMPCEYPKEVSSYPERVQPQWSKKQWDTIQQLKAQVLFLSSKVNEMRAKASKGKPEYTIK